MKFINKIINWIKKDEFNTINELNLKLELEKYNMDNIKKELSDIEFKFNKLSDDYINLKEDYNSLQYDSELEQYWNNKITKCNSTWRARPIPGEKGKLFNNIECDLRIFFKRDTTLPAYTTGCIDDRAIQCYDYAVRCLKYVEDEDEFWEFAFETLKIKKVDCEGGAIFTGCMMLTSGIPYWRIRLNKGYVLMPNGKKGYHVWLTYLRELDNEWYVLDWCYYPDKCKNFGLKWKDAEKYFVPDASWNEKYCFIKQNK